MENNWAIHLLCDNPMPHPNFAVITFNTILTTAPSYYCGWQSLDYKRLSHYLKWSRLDCIFGVFSALPWYQKAPTLIKLCLCLFIYNLNAGGGGQKEGTKMFCFNTNACVMMHVHKWWFTLRQSMMLWLIFF